MKSVKTDKGAAGRGLIYVVDDEAMMVTLIDAILEAGQHERKVFRDPELLLKSFAAARVKPAVLITDFAMGALNGLEVIERCVKLHPALKTILVSGTVDENFARFAPVKPDRFLAKPFQSRTLLDLIGGLLRA
jgi:FixJ family two-component response regulator